MNKHNIHVARLRKYILDSNIIRPGRNFYSYIIYNYKNILKNKQIKLDIFKTESEMKSFIYFNRTRLIGPKDEKNEEIDYYLVPEIADEIILILEDYKKSLEILNESRPSAEQKYVNAKEIIDIKTDEEGIEYTEDDGHDYIKPNYKTKYMDVMQNLFLNNNVQFVFNKTIDVEKDVQTNTTIKTVTFKITGKGEDVIIPTRYEVTCRAQEETGECMNKVSYFQGHFSSTIKCTLNNSDKKGHTIKNPESQQPKENRKLYSYIAKVNDDDKDGQLLLFSMQPIKKDLFKCNYIFVQDKVPYILVLGIEYVDDKDNPLTGNILIKDKNKLFFVEDIYDSLKEYYNKYHNYNITNQNQIVAWFVIIQLITKIILDHRYHGIFVGSSGSGKTFISEILVKMFTFNFVNVLGSMMTRNRFLGGKSNIISQLYNTSFVTGYVHNKDIITIDEATEKLDNYANPKFEGHQNLYTWMKMVDQKIDLGMQGSYEATPTASIIMFGNLEQLKSLRDNYNKQLKRKYKNLSNGESVKSHIPIYKAPEWYKNYGDENLGKAHAIIRNRYYNSYHYITNLPEAEMSRYTFFVALEDIQNGYNKINYSGDFRLKINVHRNEFVEELKEVFDKAIKEEIPKEFIKEIHEWVNYYLEFEPNNYRFSKLKGVNMHVFNHLRDMIVDILWLDKVYYKKEIKFTEKDKELIQYILKFNYNSLDKEEANMSKEPQINNMYFDEAEVELYENQRQEEYKSKLLQDEHSLDIDLDDQPLEIEETEGGLLDEFS